MRSATTIDPATRSRSFGPVLADQQRLDAAETMRVRNAKLMLGIALRLSGRLDEALPLIREAVALERKQNPAESDDRLAFATSLAIVLGASERTEEWRAQEELVRRPHLPAGRGAPAAGRPARSPGEARRASPERSADVKALVAEAQSMARPAEETTRVEAELVAALDAQLQLRFVEALERLQRTLEQHRIEKMPLKLQSDVAAQLGTVRLELGDLASAEKELLAAVSCSRGRRSSLHRRADLPRRDAARPARPRPAEAEQLLLPLLASWERVNPEAPGRGEVLHWLAEAERGQGKLAAARRDAERADALLQRSPLPALRRLVHAPTRSRTEYGRGRRAPAFRDGDAGSSNAGDQEKGDIARAALADDARLRVGVALMPRPRGLDTGELEDDDPPPVVGPLENALPSPRARERPPAAAMVDGTAAL